MVSTTTSASTTHLRAALSTTVVAEWLANGRQVRSRCGASGLTVNELIVAYLTHADAYCVKNNQATAEPGNIRLALRPLHALYGSTVAAEFGPLALKTVRQAYIDAGLCRNEFNKRTRHIVRLFNWAMSDELVPPPVHHASQAEIARLREARGERVIGYKLGCTSSAVQKQLGIGEPIFARLVDTECLDSDARVSRARYANLAVEGELAVRLARDLSASLPASEDGQDTIESIFPVIELHHYVIRSPKPCAQELIASNGMHAGFVLAERSHIGPLVNPQNLAILFNGVKVGVSDKPWTMSDLVASVRWLADGLGERGLGLSCGQVILTGSPSPLYRVGPGGQVVVVAPPLGRCCVTVDP
jgi:2-keto-4-pentenoate hydratase